MKGKAHMCWDTLPSQTHLRVSIRDALMWQKLSGLSSHPPSHLASITKG